MSPPNARFPIGVATAGIAIGGDMRGGRSGTRRRRALLLASGPALVSSIAYIDPGNLATNIQAGSRFGDDLLWVVVLASVVGMLFQSLSARLGIVTGLNLAELCRERLPRPLVWAMWAASEFAAMATELAELLGCAIGLSLLFHVPVLVGMVVTAAVTYAALTLLGEHYRRMEIVIAAFLAIVAICYVIELSIEPLSWASIGLHLFVPSIPNGEAFMLVAGIVGATVMPHVLYLHSALTQDRPGNGLDEAERVRFSDREVVVALSIAGLINLAMVVLASGAFHAEHPGGVEIEAAYHLLTPMLGAAASVVFLTSLIASGLASSIVGTSAGQVIMQGFVRLPIPLWLRRLVTMVPALVVVALGCDSTHALIISQVVLSFVLPVPMVALIVFTRSRDVMGSFASAGGTHAAAVLGCALVVALNLVLLAGMLGWQA
jgi:manganese transport protein